MQVLVVEDEALIRMSICDLLEEAGFACAAAANAREALALLDGGLLPGILVTDFNLGPGLNGRALSTEALAMLPDLAVVHVTANPECVLEHGLRPRERVIAKPFEADELVQAVLRLRPGRWFGGAACQAPAEMAAELLAR